MVKRKQQAVTLGHVLVGAQNPGGCSHTQFFVVFVLRREAGYFPELERRISIAWLPSPAAHMISNIGKPPKTAQGEVREGCWGRGETGTSAFTNTVEYCKPYKLSKRWLSHTSTMLLFFSCQQPQHIIIIRTFSSMYLPYK